MFASSHLRTLAKWTAGLLSVLVGAAPAAALTTSATEGQTVTFSVTAGGTAPFTYQWYRNGTAILGASGAQLSLSPVKTTDAGSYTVTVSNKAGSATSTLASLMVAPRVVAPTITSSPEGRTVIAGSPTTFTVVASGTAPFGFQWHRNGTAIGGATGATYAIAAATAADAGTYTVSVSNAAGTVTSAPAALVVQLPPTIATQPASVTVKAGQPATFAVAANGTAPFAYQWYRNGAAIGGATGATLSIGATTAADAGSYSVAVSNAAGSVQSGSAVLTVQPVAATLVEVVPSSATARGAANSSTGAAKLLDGSTSSAWMDFSGTSWVRLAMPAPTSIVAYSITSASDYPAGDPASWTLSGSADGVNWQPIDTRTGQSWTARKQARDFALSAPTSPFLYFRFDFTSKGGSLIQLAELELFRFETEGTGYSSSIIQLVPTSILARGATSSDVAATFAFDGRNSTKWTDASGTTWVQVKLAAAAHLEAYGFTSADTNAQYDPTAWTLYGSNDGNTWTAIESRAAQAWSARLQTRDFILEARSAAYQWYRIALTSASTSTQLAEIELFGN